MTIRHCTQDLLRKHTLLILLILAAVNGTLFIFLVPPWEHYDEPGHFEYAWLAANRENWPEKGDYDQSMRREVGASMLEHDFHEYSIYHILKIEDPISIIIPQTGDVPLYYFLVSLPLRLIRYSDITFQLYLARFVSLSLFIGTIFFAYKTNQLIFGETHPMTWMVPAFLIALPGFADMMTAVNNDVGAITAFSIFIWAGTKLILEGFSIKQALILLISIAASLTTKSTAWLAAPLGVLVISFSLINGRSLKWLVLTLVGLGLLGLALLFSWNEAAPAYFYANNEAYVPTIKEIADAPVGERIIVQEGQQRAWSGLRHILTAEDFQKINGLKATLGSWIWAEAPVELRFPVINCRGDGKTITFSNEPIQLTDQPQFFAFSTQLPDKAQEICWVQFYAAKNPDNTLYWDGLVLTTGVLSSDSPPNFNDPNAEEGTWEDRNFVNLIRNGSGEKPWPKFSNLAQNLIFNRLNFSSTQLMTITDPDPHLWYFKISAATIFRSFWGNFGWGNVYILGKHPYRIFLGFLVINLLGLSFGISKLIKQLKFGTAFFFGLAIVSQIIMVLLKGMGSWYARTFIPSARYFYPAILPTALGLIWGIYIIIDTLQSITNLPKIALSLCYSCALISLTIWSHLTLIINF